MNKPAGAITTNSFLIFALSTSLLFAGCNKENNTSNNTQTNTATAKDEISTGDVTEAVTEAVSGSTSGMVTQTEQTAAMAAAVTISCGGKDTTLISDANPQGFLITWNYELRSLWTCVCSGGTASQYNVTATGFNNYSVILMSSTDTTNAQISMSGVQSSAANFVLNETYTRTGTIQSLIGSQHSFNSTITMTGTNVTISKSNNQIVSGSAAVQFTGTSTTGTAANHTANITFLGDNQATLVVDNANPSTISW